MFGFGKKDEAPKIGIEDDTKKGNGLTKGRVAAAVAGLAIAAGGVSQIDGGSSSTDKLNNPAVPEKHDDGILPGNPNLQEKHDDGILPGNLNVPADQDMGTPDIAASYPPQAGVSPPDVPRQEPDLSENPLLKPFGTVSAETGINPDLTGSAVQVPGTSNEGGQGGFVDPNQLPKG